MKNDSKLRIFVKNGPKNDPKMVIFQTPPPKKVYMIIYVYIYINQEQDSDLLGEQKTESKKGRSVGKKGCCRRKERNSKKRRALCLETLGAVPPDAALRWGEARTPRTTGEIGRHLAG